MSCQYHGLTGHRMPFQGSGEVPVASDRLVAIDLEDSEGGLLADKLLIGQGLSAELNETVVGGCPIGEYYAKRSSADSEIYFRVDDNLENNAVIASGSVNLVSTRALNTNGFRLDNGLKPQISDGMKTYHKFLLRSSTTQFNSVYDYFANNTFFNFWYSSRNPNLRMVIAGNDVSYPIPAQWGWNQNVTFEVWFNSVANGSNFDLYGKVKISISDVDYYEFEEQYFDIPFFTLSTYETQTDTRYSYTALFQELSVQGQNLENACTGEIKSKTMTISADTLAFFTLNFKFSREGFDGTYAGGDCDFPYSAFAEDGTTLSLPDYGVVTPVPSQISAVQFQFQLMAGDATCYIKINGDKTILGTITSIEKQKFFYFLPDGIELSANDEVLFGFNGTGNGSYTGLTATAYIRNL